jgi:hypothetical protein
MVLGTLMTAALCGIFAQMIRNLGLNVASKVSTDFRLHR